MMTSLLLTALLMGLAGGPHCIAMCSTPCAAIGQGGAGRPGGVVGAMCLFQLGRVVGYGALGALAAASVQTLGWLTTQSAALRPLWVFLHVAAIVLGLLLLLSARQPIWLENAARQVWGRVRAWQTTWGHGAPLVMGGLWALMPCGLLYSALMVAALSGGPWRGAFTMAIFALGTSVALMLGPWIVLSLRSSKHGEWAIRIAGLALAATAAWGLWMGLMHDQAPWCLTPAA